ncbi:MAG: hypothetical protein WC783_04205 [Candidatus Paceibacterota bacterium]|jgi:hypothetical protein
MSTVKERIKLLRKHITEINKVFSKTNDRKFNLKISSVPGNPPKIIIITPGYGVGDSREFIYLDNKILGELIYNAYLAGKDSFRHDLKEMLNY